MSVSEIRHIAKVGDGVGKGLVNEALAEFGGNNRVLNARQTPKIARVERLRKIGIIDRELFALVWIRFVKRKGASTNLESRSVKIMTHRYRTACSDTLDKRPVARFRGKRGVTKTVVQVVGAAVAHAALHHEMEFVFSAPKTCGATSGVFGEIGGGKPADEVDVVHAAVVQGVAFGARTREAGRVFPFGRAMGNAKNGKPANGTISDQVVCASQPREIAAKEVAGQEQRGQAGKGARLLEAGNVGGESGGGGRRGCEGFFAEDVFACGEGAENELRADGRGRVDADGSDGWIVEQGVKVAGMRGGLWCDFAGELEAFGREVADVEEAPAGCHGVAGQCSDMFDTHVACADGGNAARRGG